MKLAELQEMGAFVPSAPVPREIKWKMGEKEYSGSVFIRQLSVGEHDRVVARFDSKTGGNYRAATISALIGFGDNGEEQLTVEQAGHLHIELADALMEAIAEVNGQYAKGNSQPPSASSTS